MLHSSFAGISERLLAERPQCSFCGLHEGDTYIERGVTHRVRGSVDHIDRDTSHSERANLRVLSARCGSGLTGDGWRR